MTRGLFRIIVAVLILLGSVTMLPGLLDGAATAQPTGSSNSTTPKFLKLSLDSVNPSTVTTTGDNRLTVAGTVTNIGDRVVDDVSIRIQRAAAVVEPGDLRYALRLDQVNYDLTGPFEDVAERLSPGQRKQFTVTIPLRPDGSGGPSLDITQPGVYPLLLNVNGEPAYGNQARLDDARFLLPVLGLPSSGQGAAPVQAAANAPVATTMVWPLADRPRMIAGVPGSVNGKAELTDDDLAASLAKGGRLDQLLGALETALAANGAAKGGLASALCVAIDPDLLLTAQAMTNGYRVLASPSDPGGATRDGSGAEAALAWLERLRAVAGSVCTVALPFAQVDISALAAVNDAGLTARALHAPADIVDTILSTRSVRGIGLPDSGSIDTSAGSLLRSHGVTTAVLADSAAVPVGAPHDADSTQVSSGTGFGGSIGQTPTETAAPPLVRIPEVAVQPVVGALQESAPPGGSGGAPAVDPALRVATFDIWSATALAAVGSNPPTPSFTPARVRYEVTNDSRAARLQDALGAISWSALDTASGRPRSLLLMPPQQWGANRDEAGALLRQVDSLLRANLATARPFTDLLTEPADGQSYELNYLSRAAEDAAPERFVLPVREQATRTTELGRALVDVPESEPTPQQFLSPLGDDLIRVLTLSDRRSGNSAQPDTFAQRRLDQTTTALDRLYRSVTVLPPGGVYTLASEQSPLLLVARNDLPVAIRVRFLIGAPAETKITDIGEQLLPPNGIRSFQIPSEVSDSRNLVIPISLTTPDGVALGDSTVVSVRSNAYGQALAIITACAALLLVVLAGRRLWRRFRGKPDPADEGVDSGIRRRVVRYGRLRRKVMRESHEG
ncbi:DUF6049 family protein [Nocardia bovistercoris]|uniref:Glycoprotein n=1 Tax=Nocardia bovistercoris TaxID=2785916 RepID=A0A931N7Z5_9NOCA|nr:DUF6049 family protein [Nocardia bovistercoris]MBH0781238.1 hypothetical protein [Nocardia bovistercoris]